MNAVASLQFDSIGEVPVGAFPDRPAPPTFFGRIFLVLWPNHGLVPGSPTIRPNPTDRAADMAQLPLRFACLIYAASVMKAFGFQDVHLELEHADV